MSRWILDTDHVSLLLAGHPQVSRRVAAVGADVAITIVTVQELFNGWVTRINNAKDVQELVRLYDKLNRTVLLCSRVPVVTFDQAAGECYQQLLLDVPALAKKRLQKDVRIATIALSLGAIAVTCNHQDFSQIPGLQLENWTE